MAPRGRHAPWRRPFRLPPGGQHSGNAGERRNNENSAGEVPSQAPPGKAGSGEPEAASGRIRAGRNLPAALAVGITLGGLALLTLFTVKATFLLYMGAMAGVALWELGRALAVRGIRPPLLPVAAGGIAAVPLAYWEGERALVACLAITVVAMLAWRLPRGALGYLRDVTAGAFALLYVPLMASFVALMLAPADGARRTLTFLILAVCSDVGGYAAGVLVGKHLLAPSISPKKTWEGLAGSLIACVAGGAIAVTLLLHGQVWQGVLTGLGALAAATSGDLAESMIKRDLEIKDMGSALPGHGGILDRIDSLLMTAPVVWLLLAVFLPPPS
jgi:phosphatidate cytidylyltransferase